MENGSPRGGNSGGGSQSGDTGNKPSDFDGIKTQLELSNVVSFFFTPTAKKDATSEDEDDQDDQDDQQDDSKIMALN